MALVQMNDCGGREIHAPRLKTRRMSLNYSKVKE